MTANAAKYRRVLKAIAATTGVAVALAVALLALAPRWINLGAVRARIDSAMSSALGGAVTYERIDLSWFPRTEIVVRSLKLSVPGARGTVRAVRVSPALLPLLRGRVSLSRIGVDGLDMTVDLPAPTNGEEKSASMTELDPLRGLLSLGSQTLDIEVSRGRVVLSRPGRRDLVIEGLRAKGALRSSEGKAEFTVSHLSMESPRLRAEGSLRVDAAVPRVELDARGSGLDVTPLRGKLLRFAGDDPTVAAIFAILRGGTLTSFSFASAGKSPDDLGALEHMAIRGTLEDGTVRVQGPGLELAEVRADVALEGGVLTARNAAARIGNSRASDGSVLVGLAKNDDRLRVDAEVHADLAEIPAVLARVIHDDSFRGELALVESLEGSATGRITIGDRKSAPETSVSVTEMRFSATYRRMPWPVEVHGGRFELGGKSVGVSGLVGSVGRSTFSDLAARARIGNKAVLESASGTIRVSLEDFLEGARFIPKANALAANVGRLAGSVLIDVRRLSGPLARLGEASVDASGTFKEVFLSSSSSSFPSLSITSGRFEVGDDAIRVTDVEARALDASLRISGAWTGWRGGSRAIAATADGEVGPKGVAWGWERASLPEEFRPAAPIALHTVRLGLAGGGAFTLAGDFVVASGPRLTLDLAADGQTTEARNLGVADEGNLVSIGFRRQAGAFNLRFEGRLAAATLAKVFEKRERRRGGYEGNFRAFVPAENPVRPTAEGTLTVTDLDVSTPAGLVTVERLDLRAAREKFIVSSSSLVLDEQRFSAQGSATFQDEAMLLDMDVATPDLPWARIEKVLGVLEDAKKKAAETSPKTAARASLPIGGELRVSLDSFTYRDFVWKPVLADVRFDKDSVTAAIRAAEVCGISTTGEARFLPGGGVALEARVDAAGSDVEDPLTCLGVGSVGMTGSYEASVEVKGEGAVSELPRLVRGPLTFRAAKGRIGKANVLTKILGVLNATRVFSRKSRTRMGEAIPYDEITLDGEVAGGRVSIREGALSAPSMAMAVSGSVGTLDRSLDVMVLSRPSSAVDKVVKAVPVVGGVLGDNFLAVGARVTGSLDDPKVSVTPARDVGKGLVGILQRTAQLPVKVFDPSSSERP